MKEQIVNVIGTTVCGYIYGKIYISNKSNKT
jgi:hypothetical protein